MFALITSLRSSRGGDKKPHICSEIVDGRVCGTSFKRKADLARHKLCVHNVDTAKIWYCDTPRCDRNENGIHGGFTRKDHLVEHLRNYHHRHIPKRKRGKCLDEDESESSAAQPSYYYSSSGSPYSTTSYSASNYSSKPYPPISQ